MNSSSFEMMATQNFKRFWISGLLLAALLIISNVWLTTDVSPSGIIDHQRAATAAQVDAIQTSWQEAGLLGFAKVSMIVDLIFIGVYFFGAFCGGMLMRADSRIAVKRIGTLVIAGAVVFLVTDYVETIAQTIQLFRIQGSDTLANTAAAVGLTKVIAMATTLVGLFGKILTDRFHASPSPV